MKTISTNRKSDVLKALSDGIPRTLIDVAKIVGISYDATRRHMSVLRKEGKVHIASWNHGTNNFIPVFVFGGGKDADRPVSEETLRAQAKAEREQDPAKQKAYQAYISRVRSAAANGHKPPPDEVEALLEAALERERAKFKIPPPHPLMAHFYGLKTS